MLTYKVNVILWFDKGRNLRHHLNLNSRNLVTYIGLSTTPIYWVEIMTLFSIENSKSVNLVLTPYGNCRIKIILHTGCQILAGSQQSSCRFGNLVPTMYRSNQYNIWRTTRGNWGNFITTSSGQILWASAHDRGLTVARFVCLCFPSSRGSSTAPKFFKWLSFLWNVRIITYYN